MSDTIHRLLNVLIVMGLGLLIWALASLVGFMLRAGFQAIGAWDLPTKLFEQAKKFSVLTGSIFAFFRDAIAALEAAGEDHSVRALADERHRRLKVVLRRAEANIKEITQKVSGLAGVAGPAAIGAKIGEIDEKCQTLAHDMVDLNYAPEQKYAERMIWNFAFFSVLTIALACSVVNGMMLSTFIGQVFPIRIFGVPAAYPLAALLVILEIGSGLALGLSKHLERGRPLLLVGGFAAALVLATIEAVIFGIISASFDLGIPFFDDHPSWIIWFAPLGLAFVLITTIMGFLLHFTFEKRAQVVSSFSLARDLRAAKKFVKELPTRWETISAKAREAESSVADFISQLGSKTGAVSGAAKGIKQERDALIQSLREARLDDWPKLLEGGRADFRWVAVQNVSVFIVSLVAAVFYAIGVDAILASAFSPVLPPAGAAAIGVCTALAFYGLGFISRDRLELVEGSKGAPAHMLPIRATPVVLVIASLVCAGVLLGLCWAGYLWDQWTGAFFGVLAFAVGLVLVILGQFSERATRGMLLVLTILTRLLVAALHALLELFIAALLWAATILSWIIKAFIALMAIPLDLIISLLKKPAPRPVVSQPAAAVL